MIDDQDQAGDEALGRSLDAALARALRAPVLPPGFGVRLQAALVRAAADGRGRADSLARAEHEQREQLSRLQADFVRLRRRTLGTLIGGAFAAGAAVAVGMPLLEARFGSGAGLVLAALGALVGLAIGSAAWIQRLHIADRLERL